MTRPFPNVTILTDLLVYCAATLAGALTSLYIVPACRSSELCDARQGQAPPAQIGTTSQCPKPFVLAITIELVPELRKEWLGRWAELAQHVMESEPSTLSYELLEVEGKDSTFFVYERYCHKSDLHDIHQQSTPFKEFKIWCAENSPYVIKDGQGAFLSGFGHWTRDSIPH